MRKRLAGAVVAIAAIVMVACVNPNTVDFVNHHIVTRIKADTLVDQRNAWTLQSKCIPTVASAPVYIGLDIPLVQGGQDSCPWKNPTATIHP